MLQNTVDRIDFYTAFSSRDTLLMNEQLIKINNSSFKEKDAFIAVLLMKKAGFVKSVKQKLKLFSEGKLKLEQCITKDKNNGEYRFLRLSIQENCPALIKYNSNINEDKSVIVQQFKSFDKDLKAAILKYCKTSQYLNEKEL